MKTFRILLAASAAMVAINPAFAQSTGSIDFEEDTIVVTGRAIDAGIAGVQLPDSTKAKGVLTQELLSRQRAGNTVLDSINLIPGVSFQNNDPFGSAGGTLNIRGFGADRVSLTFDGVPLNDTGNYAIYSNQQLDPELIEQVNVNLGSTDVDSPTAAASGGTVNYRTRNPYDDFTIGASGSIGEFSFYRMHASVDTGVFTSFGTKAFIAGSTTGNDNVFNDYGKIKKQQINAKIYQPIGDDGDFIAIAAHYNQNRNNFFGSLPLRIDTTNFDGTIRSAGPLGTNRFPITRDERFYTLGQCTTLNVTVRAGVADPATACGTQFDYRANPSNTGNIRISSKFSLSDSLTLTVDPSYQYVKANGGGTVSAREGLFDLDPGATALNSSGYFGGVPYFGRDLNGDGDLLDQVSVLAPSQTQTRRYGLIASLRYQINDQHSVRVAYTLDHGRHRQTGEVGLLQNDGSPFDVFTVNNGQKSVNGAILQKRDRLSLAILNQISGEYRGKFLDDALTVTLGVRAPFFTRDLTNNCYTSSAGGFVECFGTGAAIPATTNTLRPTWATPQQRKLKYDAILPNVGLSYKLAPAVTLFANFSKGLQVPGTDPLYNSFFFPVGTAGAQPKAETTSSFDLGGRYVTNTLQVQATAWFTGYNNRLASAYDVDLNQTVYRNLGKVDKYGIDGSIGWSPIKQVTLYAFGSYLKSKIKDDVAAFETTTGTVFYFATAGKRESGASVYTFGGRAEAHIGSLDVGIQAKRYGKRYVLDTNLPIYRFNANGTATEVYGAVAPGYTLVDLDLRYSLKDFGAPKTWIQLNVSNLFDELYVGGIGGGLGQVINRNSTTGAVTGFGTPGFVQIGSPRALMLSVRFEM
jgi:iron complex outermembrane recepter protein